jgi:hypothetical protein
MHLHDAQDHSPHSPTTGSPPFPLDLAAWNEEEEWEDDLDGHGTNEGNEEESDQDDEEVQANMDESLPQATLPMLSLSQQLIESIKNAQLEDDLDNPALLHSIRHPPAENEPPDEITSLSAEIFNALVGGSEQMYNEV